MSETSKDQIENGGKKVRKNYVGGPLAQENSVKIFNVLCLCSPRSIYFPGDSQELGKQNNMFSG